MYEKAPETIWWNGSLVPWDRARVHVTSEVAMRGTNVFEGLRAYWQPESEQHVVVHLHRHLARLAQSARLIRLPQAESAESVARLLDGVPELIRALRHRGDLYLRPTLYIDEGRYGWRSGQVKLGCYIAGYPTDPRVDRPMSCVVSSWRRSPDLAVSPLAKVGAAYQAFRLPRIEAAMAGADEAILLNTNDTVAETGGAAVFLVRGDTVVTPPLADGVLDGITRGIVIDLLRSRWGMKVVERSVPRSELYVADEVFVCGTLDEVRIVSSVDAVPIGGGTWPVAEGVRALYLDICAGQQDPVDPAMLHTVSSAPPGPDLQDRSTGSPPL
ncbi:MULTISPECIES: aminotransferase class IV [Nocardiopsidaceae]|uniref:Aminotransferase class IV n=2 Tax=Nocardiopsidaceae TaxID=83676 RepID=A0ABY6YP76_9ACTN|nr:aminotransferase class IV [Streptomonospora nanhaiensis]WAE74041.1 aminotransferase class IV [Streptomonospora nanhaiensis]